ncbi:unnamed protein product [Psylliodes chrysocephalus]|uniref:Uncharacterized protein n=1 Tax=Psylliodes chrysocephalus TaxID=3402493 RepID=A0A9P0CX45_9CUCU|nr:unnamed protein product [Psylliodes chrysocephala]
MAWSSFVCFIFMIILNLSTAQYPPRLQIPGASLLDNSRSAQLRQQRLNAQDFIPRPRRPSQLALPAREIRPVVEEEQENYPQQSLASFDAEVNKLSIPALSTAIRQAAEQEEEPTLRPSPLPFRPERPIPITRERQVEISSSRPTPLPVLRQSVQNRQIPRPIRPVVRQELDDDEEENIPRQPIRQKVRAQQPQVFKPAPLRPATRSQYDDDGSNKKRKPVVQILRKYRTDNPDGTITWGFENEDGTFKEETLGIDCTIKGKYGYIDPEGTKREFEYEAGNKCDPNQAALDEEEEEALENAQRAAPKRPVNSGKQPQFQYRPQLAPN